MRGRTSCCSKPWHAQKRHQRERTCRCACAPGVGAGLFLHPPPRRERERALKAPLRIPVAEGCILRNPQSQPRVFVKLSRPTTVGGADAQGVNPYTIALAKESSTLNGGRAIVLPPPHTPSKAKRERDRVRESDRESERERERARASKREREREREHAAFLPCGPHRPTGLRIPAHMVLLKLLASSVVGQWHEGTQLEGRLWYR